MLRAVQVPERCLTNVNRWRLPAVLQYLSVHSPLRPVTAAVPKYAQH